MGLGVWVVGVTVDLRSVGSSMAAGDILVGT